MADGDNETKVLGISNICLMRWTIRRLELCFPSLDSSRGVKFLCRSLVSFVFDSERMMCTDQMAKRCCRAKCIACLLISEFHSASLCQQKLQRVELGLAAM